MFDPLALGQDFLLHKLLGRLGNHLMLLGEILGSEHILRITCGDQEFPTLEFCLDLGCHNFSPLELLAGNM